MTGVGLISKVASVGKLLSKVPKASRALTGIGCPGNDRVKWPHRDHSQRPPSVRTGSDDLEGDDLGVEVRLVDGNASD